MTTKKHIIASILLSICVFSALPLGAMPENVIPHPAQVISPSAVSGTELYAEQVQFYLAGQNCLVRQSAITEDPYIIDHVPLDDIAFKNASVIVLASNGIYPARYIDVHVPFNELVTFQMAVNGIVVYLSYNNSVTDISKVNTRAQRAIKILQDAFGVEFFEQVDASSRTFTLYGVAPAWPVAVNAITTHLPRDGFFKYLDVARLASTSYLGSKHLSVGFASIDPYGGSLSGFDVGGLGDLLSLLDFNATEITNFLGLNFTGETPGLFNTRTSLLFVQYEGATGGITYSTSTQAFTFNAKTALGMPANAMFKPSASVWNSMFNLNPVGILGTMIDVNVVTGNITGWNLGVDRLTIDDTILDTIYMAAGLGGSMGIDIVSILSALEFVINNVFFITSWEKTGALSKLYTNINLTRAGYEDLLAEAGLNPELLDFVLDEIILDTSPLALLGFRGLPFVPAGLLKAIPNLVVTYKNPSSTQPALVVQLDTSGSIQPFDGTINLRMNVTNVGTQRAWGMLVGHGTSSISELTGGIIPITDNIDYDVRGFYIPALAVSGSFSLFYGIENLLMHVSTISPALITALFLLGVEDDNDDGYIDMHEAGVLGSTAPYNYINAGQSRIIDLSDASLTGLYTPFDGENSNFTLSALVTGISVPPASTNNASNAQDIDGDYWNIDTAGTGTNRFLSVDFTFTNNTSNLTTDLISAIEFRYAGLNNETIYPGGNASFAIWNYNTSSWVPINNLTRAPVSINQTSILSSFDTFRIYDGDNDTANLTINLADYMDGPDHEVLIRLHLGNNVSTRLSINSFSMDYLQRNYTLLLIPPQSFAYTDITGITTRQATSNSLYVGSQNASALVVKQSLSGNMFASMAGNTATLLVTLENKGTRVATSIDVSVPLPGIITNVGSFAVNGDYLNDTISSIAAGASASISFTFTIPNSQRIPGVLVSYDNETSVVTGDDFFIRGNDWYVDAPVDYRSWASRPFLVELNATMSHVNPAVTPGLGETFSVAYAVETAHVPALVGQLATSLPVTGYFSISGVNPVNINLDGQGDGSTTKTYTKTSYKGYLVPSFHFNTEVMSSLFRYVTPAPLQIGVMSFSITKIISMSGNVQDSTFRMTRGKLLNVTVIINNTGTLNIGNYEKLVLLLKQGFTIDDNYGYVQSAFSVVGGALSISNMSLAPGQNASFSYVLRAESVGTFTIAGVVKNYFFITTRQEQSNSYTILIEEKPELVATYLGTSIGITLLIVFGSIYTKKKQDQALEDFKRRDRILYDELTGASRTYDEYLDDSKMGR